MSKHDKTVAKFKAWVTATSTKAQSLIKRIAIEAVCFALASVAAFLIVIYGKAILIIFFELTSLLSNNGMSTDTSTSSKPFEGARNIAFALTALVGGPFLVWRTILADKQTRTAQKQTAIAQEKASLDEQTHFTTLYIKSIELLGAMRVVKDAKGKDKSERAMELRLGAIYALERIARDSWKDHWPIMEVLTAYVRENSPYKEGDKPLAITTDIQAAITVIGNRNPKWIENEINNKREINLSNCSFRLAKFKGLNFDYANFSNSYFQNVDCEKSYFEGTNFIRCIFSYNFFTDTTFRNANFLEIDSSETHFTNCVFDTCEISLVSTNTIKKLESIHHNEQTALNFDICDLSYATIESLDRRKIKIYYSNFYSAHLNMTDCDNVCFDKSILCSSNIRHLSAVREKYPTALIKDINTKNDGHIEFNRELDFITPKTLSDEIFIVLKAKQNILEQIDAIISNHKKTEGYF